MREPRRAPCVLPPSQVHTGQARIRPPRCQGKNNKWPQMEREHMTIQQWGEKWAKNKKQMKGLEKEDPDVPLGMWAMLKPFPSNQHHVSAEPYYPINELYWGNKVLRISANTLKGPRAATPERLMKKKKKKKGLQAGVHCPRSVLMSRPDSTKKQPISEPDRVTQTME